MVDPTRPHSGHQGGQQATPWIAQYDNPILKPYAREVVKRISDNEDKGITHEEAATRCWPSGVPEILNLRDSLQILQTKNEVTLLYSRNQQVRHVYLDVPHANNVAPTWYGESVGHYEGGTLVVDTVGVSDKSETDRFGSPHSDKIHVVERYTLSDDKRTIKVVFTVEDPEFYATRWAGGADYRRNGAAAPEEVICAENNRNIGGGDYPVPTATKADF